MRARLVRVLAFLFACCIFPPQASAAVAESSEPAPAATEPSGPMPSTAVQKIVDEASRLAKAKQPSDSLKAADQALAAARQTNDTVGEAFAQQARGKALKDLQRPKESLSAWRDAPQICGRTRPTPDSIVALAQEEILCAP